MDHQLTPAQYVDELERGCDHREDLAALHVLARREYPDADQHEIAGVIMGRLSVREIRALATDVLEYWPVDDDLPGARVRAMAEHEVINWVCEVELDHDPDST
jgi:hypothetical protein